MDHTEKLKGSIFSSPIIPKFRLSYNSAHQLVKNIGYEVSKQTGKLGGEEKVALNFQMPQDSQFIKNFKNPLQYYKQNVSPLIFDQEHSEMSIRSLSAFPKRPVSAYEHGIFTERHDLRPHNPVKITPFEFDRLSMDSVCSKMTESIILSPGFWDKVDEIPEPLSFKSFQKIRFLGQGKFGQVHLVKHKQTGFVCAMKIISKNIVRQERLQSQISKELRIHSKLKSLNIIEFYGFFDDQQSFYILLEFGTEGSVFSKLKGKSRLEEEEIQPIAKGLCDGLKFIHGMGYVHRDIKPQNIVLQFGVPKICDFGWATDCDDIRLCKSYCGTPLYLSPQMVRKQFYGTSVDIWAVGLVVYELLVGRVPFRIWNEQDINQILVKSIQFPSYIDRSDGCEAFIRKCLEKQIFQRMEMSEALRHPFLNIDIKQESQMSYESYSSINKLLNNDDR